MDVPDDRVRQRLAPVRPAPVVALVALRRPVVDQPRPGAVDPAAAQLGVERVEDLGVQLADLESTNERLDVVLHVAAVELKRVRRPGELLQVLLQQVGDRRAGARVPALLDVAQHPVPDRVRLLLGVRTGRDDLDEVVPALGDRVLPGVDAHPQGAAREDVDAPLLAPRGPGLETSHDTNARGVRVMLRVTSLSVDLASDCVRAGQSVERATGIEPA